MQDTKEIKILCKEVDHDESRIEIICISKECDEKSRLMCTFCQNMMHNNHPKELIFFKDIIRNKYTFQIKNMRCNGDTVPRISEIASYLENFKIDEENQIHQIDEIFKKIKEKFCSDIDAIRGQIVEQQIKISNQQLHKIKDSLYEMFMSSFSLNKIKDILKGFVDNKQDYYEKNHLITEYLDLDRNQQSVSTQQFYQDEMLKCQQFQIDELHLKDMDKKISKLQKILLTCFVTSKRELLFEIPKYIDSTQYVSISQIIDKNQIKQTIEFRGQTGFTTYVYSKPLQAGVYNIRFKVAMNDSCSSLIYAIIPEAFKDNFQFQDERKGVQINLLNQKYLIKSLYSVKGQNLANILKKEKSIELESTINLQNGKFMCRDLERRFKIVNKNFMLDQKQCREWVIVFGVKDMNSISVQINQFSQLQNQVE